MKKLIPLTLLTLIFSFNTAFAQTFSDTDPIQLYYDGIEYLAAEGIVDGYPDGTYKPKNTLNRAEMLKILVEANVGPETFMPFANANCFGDVPTTEWFTPYVCYAKDQGWVVGYNNGTEFRPAQAVNFVEGLKMAAEAFDISYSADAEIWYRGLVNTASSFNYIPFDVTSFGGDLRRDQMADLVARILKDSFGLLDEYLGDRVDIVVTYETISQGIDMSKLEPAPEVVEIIEITSSGFSPSSLTIEAGTAVRFVNKDSAPHRPASDVHPTHTLYPGSDFNKCGTAQESETFDSCTNLATNETYEFTFNEIGTWGYHDHLNPTTTGTITVAQ